MPIQITTLIENSLGENLALKNEHGLSFLIETGQSKILFDTGQSGNFIHNAACLNLNLSQTTHVVLSHGHYDHSGGFKAFIQTYGTNFQLVVGSEFFLPKYACNNGTWEYLGNNFDQTYLKAHHIQTLISNEDLIEIVPNIFIIGNFERKFEFEKIDPRFHLLLDGNYQKDYFKDEIAIAIKSSKGLVLLLGCSHPGLLNIINTVTNRFQQPVCGILGGTHLIEADDDRLTKTLDYFHDLKLSFLGISHCTGTNAIQRLQNDQQPFFFNTTGTRVVLD